MPFASSLTGSISSTSRDTGTACLSLFLSHTPHGSARLVPTSTFQQCWTTRHQSPPNSWGQHASPRPVSRSAGPGARAGRCVLGHGPEPVTGDRRTALQAVTKPCDLIPGAHPRWVLQEGDESRAPGLAPRRSRIRSQEMAPAHTLSPRQPARTPGSHPCSRARQCHQLSPLELHPRPEPGFTHDLA